MITAMSKKSQLTDISEQNKKVPNDDNEHSM